uniref:Uncharacterized protein n=1 Tax=mine drainage metagenome TaxID=410659 RepID=E6QJZ0_9ZZZZ
MGKQQDRFLAMIDNGLRQAGLVGKNHQNLVFSGDVAGGDDGERTPVYLGPKVNRFNPAAWNGAAQSGSEPRAVRLDVIDILSATTHFIRAFFTKRRGSYNAICAVIVHACLVLCESALN